MWWSVLARCSPTDPLQELNMNRLAALYEDFGQSPWLDNLKRSYLTSGELRSLRDRYRHRHRHLSCLQIFSR